MTRWDELLEIEFEGNYPNGPEKPDGVPEANWLRTNPGEKIVG
ncbi:MAG TPA: hypothetical protein VHZ54_07650 [Solirubrobacterales bacterium]|jgi:hypothetical protein|nr:hypothetical protein [Solirubrobacterales bacterium]